MDHLILASTSKYRRQLLKQLAIPFESIAPNIDETAFEGEAPLDLVKRLSLSKARIVSKNYSKSFVLGSDQIATYNDLIIGKPNNRKNAIKQLSQFSNNQVIFHTAVSLINGSTNFLETQVSTVVVKFRLLSIKQIEDYLDFDLPYDCAGSFKVESLGISLFESIENNDPTSLQGLPLITVMNLLNKANFNFS